MLKRLIADLSQWFNANRRILPWRETPTLYRVYVSETMLQQTQVKTVIPYFEKFINSFPDEKALAQASENEVLSHWSGLGYYSRARNLHQAAKIIVQQGFYPKTAKEWMKLPGVGEYTAGAILSIACDQPQAILDGNVKRVLYRLRLVKKANIKRLWRISRLLVHSAYQLQYSPSQINQALMELGATVCTFKRPNCEQCPWNKSCKAYRLDNPLNYPPPNVTQWQNIPETVYWIEQNQTILLRLRQKGEWRNGLWDLPETIPSFVQDYNISSEKPATLKLTVTNHKISRTILKLTRFILLESADNNYGFYPLADILANKIPLGASLLKSIKALQAFN